MFERLFITSMPDGGMIASFDFSQGDVAVLLLLAAYLTGVIYLLLGVRQYLPRMPRQLVLWAKLVLAVFLAGAVVVAYQVWHSNTELPTPFYFSLHSLIFCFLIITSATFFLISLLLSMKTRENSAQVVLATIVFIASFVFGHMVLIHGSDFEGQIFYLRNMFFKLIGLGVVLTVVSFILLQMTITVKSNSFKFLSVLVSATVMATALYLFHVAALQASVFIPEGGGRLS